MARKVCMNRSELKLKIDLHRRELKSLESIAVGCKSCEHFSMPECMKYESNPPPDVVQQGCDEWTYDNIPF